MLVIAPYETSVRSVEDHCRLCRNHFRKVVGCFVLFHVLLCTTVFLFFPLVRISEEEREKERVETE